MWTDLSTRRVRKKSSDPWGKTYILRPPVSCGHDYTHDGRTCRFNKTSAVDPWPPTLFSIEKDFVEFSHLELGVTTCQENYLNNFKTVSMLFSTYVFDSFLFTFNSLHYWLLDRHLRTRTGSGSEASRAYITTGRGEYSRAPHTCQSM